MDLNFKANDVKKLRSSYIVSVINNQVVFRCIVVVDNNITGKSGPNFLHFTVIHIHI